MRENMNKENRIHSSEFYELKDTNLKLCVSEEKDISNIYDTILNNNYGFCCLQNSKNTISGVLYKEDINKIENDRNKMISISKSNIFYCDREISNFDIDYTFYRQPHKYIPLIDSNNTFKGIIANKRPLFYSPRQNAVLIMAGGLGTRLRPYTEKTPKPLLEIAGISILERILFYFRYYGFRTFYISVNYLAENIKNKIGDGSQFGIKIEYIHEKNRLGTAGALSLISRPKHPILVTNGDLLMDVDLNKFLYIHNKRQSTATMCTYRYAYQIPYGVVQSDNDRYMGTIEKPMHYFHINTGLYCISPNTWDYFRKAEKLDMPTLFERIHSNGDNVYTYSHIGKWMDIGTVETYHKLQHQ